MQHEGAPQKLEETVIRNI